MALFRPQFETLIRGVWLLEAADEKWVRQYHEPLSEESTCTADKAPGVKAMFDELLKLDDPRVKGIVEHLDEYRAQSLRALNSFTHGGMHPMSRSGTGYPMTLVDNVDRCANGLVCYAAQMAAPISTDAEANMVLVRASIRTSGLSARHEGSGITGALVLQVRPGFEKESAISLGKPVEILITLVPTFCLRGLKVESR